MSVDGAELGGAKQRLAEGGQLMVNVTQGGGAELPHERLRDINHQLSAFCQALLCTAEFYTID